MMMKPKHLLLFFAFCFTTLSSNAQETSISWRNILKQEQGWYKTEVARNIADQVLIYQHPNGGWAKNIDMAAPLSSKQINALQTEKRENHGTTIDNGATTTQMRFLEKMIAATDDAHYKNSYIQALDYILEAQYKSGGWPQFYPLRKGYYSHITYNDNAMIGVMKILFDITNSDTYSFISSKMKARSRRALQKGIEVILKTQVILDGKRTIWCAQHDESTFLPAKARAYELPSLSGSESVGILEFLMKQKEPSKQIIMAIEAGVNWFKTHKITGKKVKWIEVKDSDGNSYRDRVVVDDPNAAPLWARFYDLETQKPFYVGRDGIKKDELAAIEIERRTGYSYISDYAETLLNKTYPHWIAKHKK